MQLIARPAFPTEKIHGRWDAHNAARAEGFSFLFCVGNDPDRILFWARMPIIALSIALGAIIYLFAEAKFDRGTALMATLLYAFSPTVLAHSRYVTTDLAATFGFTIAILSYLAFLELPSSRRTFAAGIAIGVALLAKFSTILLLVLLPIILAEWLVAAPCTLGSRWPADARKLITKSTLAVIMGMSIVWCAYAILLRNNSIETTLQRTAVFLVQFNCPAWLALVITQLSRTILLRPFGEYLLGVASVYAHVLHGGDPIYFMGITTPDASHLYFPTLYLLKESIPEHLLLAIAVFAAFRSARRLDRNAQLITRAFIRHHFTELAIATFVILYWIMALRSNFMVGIRHLLPTFPLLYVLVARRLSVWGGLARCREPAGSFVDRRRYLLMALFGWVIAESVFIYPHYLCYYNELAGESLNGHWYAGGANYDWGQDQRRLQRFLNEHGIQRVSVAADEPESLKYYLGDAYIPWKISWGPPHGWFAISATWRDKLVSQWLRKSGKSGVLFPWLVAATPVERAGYCYWLYKFP